MAITLLSLVLLPVVYYTGLFTYRLFFHPLAKLPGPKLLAISSLPRGIRHSIFGLWYKDVQALHEQYGRIFRVGPDEIAVDGDPGWEDVFAFRKQGKDDFARDPDFFNQSTDGTVEHSLFLTDRAGHSRQRRILSHAFSQNAMYEQEPLIKHYVDLFISRIGDHAAEGSATDVVKWFNYTTFDIIGELMYGEPFDCLEKSEMHPWVGLIFGALHTGEIIVFLKRYAITRSLLNVLIGKKMAAGRADHKALTKERTDRRVALGVEGHGKKDFMWYILKNNNDKGMSGMEIKMNSEALIVAGSETTATCLSATMHFLATNPEKRRIMVDEIRSKFTSDNDISIMSTMDLTYMQACIEESLRMFPPALVSPTRVSPGDFVGGYYIPKNTKVYLHQYATYHSPKNWHLPDEYRPERFLPQDHPLYDASFAKDNKKSFYPFSHGPANCIGKNLAYAELRIILARLLWKFDVFPEPGAEKWLDGMRGYTLWDKPPLMLKFAAAKH